MSENRLAQVGIIVENKAAVETLNSLLSEFGEYIIGRMGLPLAARGINVISVVMDAPADRINALTGKLGNLDGVSAKTLFARAENGRGRPLLAENAEQKIQALLVVREPLYRAAADCIVTTDGKDAQTVARAVLKKLQTP